MIVLLLKALTPWIFLFPMIYAIGYRLRLLVNSKNSIIRGVLYCALGLACLSYGVVLLGVFSMLNRVVIGTILFTVFISNIRIFPMWGSWIKEVFIDLFAAHSIIEKCLVSIFLVSLLVVFIGTLSPEIGGDALGYQLTVPKFFLNQGSLTPDLFEYNTYFPLFLNHLFLIGLAVGSAVTAKLFHFLCGFLLVVLVKAIVVKESKNTALATFMVLVIWLTPTFNNMLSTTYVDLGLTFFSFLSLYVLIEAFKDNDKKTFLLSGLLLSCAISVKYLGAISALAMLCLWVVYFFKNKNIMLYLKNGLVWSFGIICGISYWFIRNYISTGNPFYPYFSKFFGTDQGLMLTVFADLGMLGGFIHFPTIFYHLSINPTVFGNFGDRIGVFYLLLVPFSIIASIVESRSRYYCLFALTFLILWFQIAQLSRYLVPVLPVIVMTSVIGITWAMRKVKVRIQQVCQWMSISILLVYMVASIYHYRYTYLLFVGKWTPYEYRVYMDATAGITNWINESLPQDAKIIVEDEPRLFYFDRTTVRDIALRKGLHYDRANMSVDSFLDFLKSQSVTHILLRNLLGDSGSDDNSLLRRFASSKYSRLIHSVTSENIRDRRSEYKLYEL